MSFSIAIIHLCVVSKQFLVISNVVVFKALGIKIRRSNKLLDILLFHRKRTQPKYPHLFILFTQSTRKCCFFLPNNLCKIYPIFLLCTHKIHLQLLINSFTGWAGFHFLHVSFSFFFFFSLHIRLSLSPNSSLKPSTICHRSVISNNQYRYSQFILLVFLLLLLLLLH